MSAELTMTFREEQFKRAIILLFVLGSLLRIILALVNREANDYHLDVVSVIAHEHRFPAKEELWEAFQPKLYHLTVAVLWNLLSAHSALGKLLIAQLLSCLAGIVTLGFVLIFLTTATGVSARTRFLTFALVALNPGLIGINAQATNDSFVILFATLALFSGYRFFEHGRFGDFSWMSISAGLAGLSKGNGLVVAVAIGAMFVLTLLPRCNRHVLTRGRTLSYGIVFGLGVLAVMIWIGPYGQHYRRYGSPFVINILPAPFPKLYEKTYIYKPGVTSIVDSYLTFRLLGLLRTPVITDDRAHYPLHRTSLWSQLYGRAHFLHFDAWPPSWQLPTGTWPGFTAFVRNLGRVIFLCALLPSGFLLVALWRRAVGAVRWLAHAKSGAAVTGNMLLDGAVLGYLAFIVCYSLRYRDFAVMKAIFLFPGLLGFVRLFASECEQFYQRYQQKKLLCGIADLIFRILLLCYIVDVLALIGQLSLFPLLS